MASAALLEAVAITAELTGSQISAAAARVMCEDLTAYPEPQVMGALKRCRKELRGKLSLSEIVLRLDDGRPGVEEAWALLPKDEIETAVITDEMAYAMGIAQSLIEMGDTVAARMAFKESYVFAITKAREEHRPVNWFASLGHDKNGREGAIRRAVELGRLSASQAQKFIPDLTQKIALANVPKPIGELIRNVQVMREKLDG